MVKIEKLSSGYDDLQVIKDVSLGLEVGTISVLMGPNGAGKSTLLKSIFNLTNVTSGKIFFEGENITGLPAHKLLSKGVAFVSQGRVNFGNLSVQDNLHMGLHFEKNKNMIDVKMNEIYKQFPVLKEKENQPAFSLSGGQQQMLAIGRALMSSPKLLLMDEPSLGLAPKLVKEVFANIKDIKDNFGVTILIVEHNLKSLMEIADYGFVMVQGQIVAEGKCSKLKDSDIMKKVFVGKFD